MASGGGTWRTWSIAWWPLILFVLAIAFNALRFVLWFKTKRLEHDQAITGVYNEFRLTGGWEQTHATYGWLSKIGLAIVALHTLRFLMMPVPM